MKTLLAIVAALNLRRHFTDAEIIELGMVTGQFIGFGRPIAALDLENPRQPED